MQRQTTFAKPGEVDQNWHLIDAQGRVLGRMATKIATILQGKHRPEYTPFVDTGDYVIVINAADIVLTGRKAEQKFQTTYSGYPGGQRQVSYGKLLQKHPERVIELAVKRMLPKTKLGRAMFKKLKVYPGPKHDHAAQKPELLAL
jgi:large subunit ribosomal protein L13